MALKDKFASANTTNDGKLTKAQAETAGLKRVVREFDQIDTAHAGYITIEQVRTFRKAATAAKSGDEEE